ncbi:glycosyltransferase [Dactylosporangium darangshiense]|uniref:glycosyltransferase n=1 Tax=Dactylosporangium darangshiense TaxID=579108 RepID=UPI00362F278C
MLRAQRRVRPRPQPPRLAAAGDERVLPHPAAHHRARLLLAVDPAGVPAGPLLLRVHLRRRPRPGPGLRRHHLSRHRRAAVPVPRRAGESLVAFGRIHPDKGTAEAIRIARATGRRLLICGPVHDERYHAEEVMPRVDGDQIVYAGNVGPAERADILGSAAALLHPIGFAEPFGLSVVEAMACGTPVVAYPLGSMPEVVDEGVTGYLATGVAEAAGVLDDALKLDRTRVRARALERFSAERMVDDYLQLYRRMVG